MRVIVGLGNPGPAYVQSRHNVGFMVLQAVAGFMGFEFCPQGAVAEARGSFEGKDVRLVLPQTYMNRSGTALASMSDPPHVNEIVLVYDDVDLSVGAVRIRRTGGSGGHRGVSSVIEAYGHGFVRVRIGVGRPPESMDTAAFVLAPMSELEHREQAVGVIRGAEAVKCIVADGVDVAMRNYNGHPPALPS